MIELFLISAGLSLDVFVVHVCVGAGFSRIHKKNMFLLSLLFGGAQVLALAVGNGISRILGAGLSERRVSSAYSGWEILSFLIFIGLGIYMFYKAQKNEPVFERRNDEVNWRRMRFLAVLTGGNTLLAGIGIGLWNVEIHKQALILFPVTVLQSFLGIAIGYWLGCEHNRKAYGIGGILFLIAGLDVIITCCM